MLMERCYFNSAPIAVSFTKNVLFHRFNGVIRNEYELFGCILNVPTQLRFRVRILQDSPVTTMHRGQHVRT